MLRGPRVPIANSPARYELGVRANGRPRPNVPVAKLPPKFLRNILFLGVTERPNFIALNALTRQIHHNPTLEGFSGGTNLRQELENGIKGDSCETGSGAKLIAFDQGIHDLNTFVLA
jgi:hypothetical protein